MKLSVISELLITYEQENYHVFSPVTLLYICLKIILFIIYCKHPNYKNLSELRYSKAQIIINIEAIDIFFKLIVFQLS